MVVLDKAISEILRHHVKDIFALTLFFKGEVVSTGEQWRQGLRFCCLEFKVKVEPLGLPYGLLI